MNSRKESPLDPGGFVVDIEQSLILSCSLLYLHSEQYESLFLTNKVIAIIIISYNYNQL